MDASTHESSRGRAAVVRRLGAALLAAGVVISAAVNLHELRRIDSELRHNYSAVHVYDSGDIFAVGMLNLSQIQRVAPFHYFGKLYPGSEVIIPASGVSSVPPFRSSMLAFGRITNLSVSDYDAMRVVDLSQLEEWRIPAERFAPRRRSIIERMDERVMFFAPRSSSGTFLVVLPEGAPRRDRPIAFVDLALLDSTVLAEVGR